MNRLVLQMTWVAVGLPAAAVCGQAEPFTYQGQLKQQGLPLTVDVDMKFSLFDSDTSDVPLAGPLVFDGQSANAAVAVINGLFTVELDFGTDAILQGGRWIQIEVRAPHDPADSESYTVLTPRQHITAAPLALGVPGLASSPAGGVEVAGDIHTPGEVIASAFSSNSPLIFKVNPADVECARFDDATCFLGLGTDAPGARLHLGGVPGVDGVMFPDGTLQTTAAGTVVGGDSLWSLSLNNDIFYSQGNVGIGTTAPAAKLDIAATGDGAELLRFSTERPWVFRQIRTGPVTGLELRSTVGQKIFEITTDDNTNVAAFVADSTASRVGIGTIAPNHRLRISGGPGWTTNGWTGSLELDNAAAIGWHSNAGGQRFGIGQSGGGLYFFRTASDPGNAGSPATYDMVISDAGRIGLGTTTPTSRLDIAAQDGLRISGFQPFFTLTDTSAGNARVRLASAGGSFHFFTEASFATGVPSATLSDFTTTINCADFKIGHPTRRGLAGRALVDNGDHLVINFARDWGRTAVHGLLQVNALQILGGADLSEQFDVAPAIEEFDQDDDSIGANGRDAAVVESGVVVCIDPENPGKLVICTHAYDHTVAGVVSGAGGVKPGMTMGQEGSIADGRHPVALTGRVYTQCDAASGAIRPGDLLTTSGTPGHAMKAGDRDHSHGAIIGKAMTPLAAGERGLVLVLVNLQ